MVVVYVTLVNREKVNQAEPVRWGDRFDSLIAALEQRGRRPGSLCKVNISARVSVSLMISPGCLISSRSDRRPLLSYPPTSPPGHTIIQTAHSILGRMDFGRSATYSSGMSEGGEWKVMFPEPKVSGFYFPLRHA